MLLEHQGVLTHQRVAHDPEEDTEARERRRVQLEFGGRRAGGKGGPRESADESEQAHAQAESNEEPTSSDPSPGEMEAAKEDEDPAEVRCESKDGQDDVQHEPREQRRVARVRQDVLIVCGSKVVVDEFSGEQERRRQYGEDGGIAVADLAHAPPGAGFCHRRRPTSRRILMAFSVTIARAASATPVLK